MVIGEAQVPANTLLGLLVATGGVVAGAVCVGATTARVQVAEGGALGAGSDGAALARALVTAAGGGGGFSRSSAAGGM